MSSDDITAALKPLEEGLVAIRRDIHAHPETAFEEVRTAALVAERLRAWGLEVTEHVGRTGVVGTLRGRAGGAGTGNRAIGLRADMDALFIEEQTSAPHRSTVPGKMHACGHDGHTTMLLGAAQALAAAPDFAGTVHFIFQPAEEGRAGARVMMEDGLFDRFPCDAVYGMHAMPGIPEGEIHTCTGPFMAASDSWRVTFRGTGGHGSAPHQGTDPSVPMAQFITGLQSIIGRNVDPMEAAVLSVGYVGGGSLSSPNVIPAEVVVAGTARSYSPAVRDLLERRLAQTAEGIAGLHGCTAEPYYERRYPPLVNAAEQAGVAAAAAAATVGEGMVNTKAKAVTGAEDFAFMLQAKPGAYVFIGNGAEVDGQPAPALHTPRYEFNDAILLKGSAYWMNLVRQELGTARG